MDEETKTPEVGAETGDQVRAGPDGGDEDFDKARALETIRQQRESERSLEKSLKEAQARLAKMEAEEKKRAQAELSETERLQAENQELAAQLQALAQERETLILRTAVERAAAALGFHNPADAYGLADLSGVEVDGGEVSGVDKALKALVKERPYLIKAVEKPDIDGSKKSDGKKQQDRDGIARRFGI